ncbi:acetylserotonin O-methyltransferase [Streptomyces rugosispiralis]|uniref:Acetylserotonin O-methyltransferase n=1 Tax=Streptomyces rugosispiralis TaxID=2967341 RepID=A0ABT1V757_9ACTN|nr:acetylserotonin O-methyltransferase [Streptomyces rugosispiralis]MCQ8193220.1 acetylserotonin O-methyltransferase [Streptomyces rugosispiralis]
MCPAPNPSQADAATAPATAPAPAPATTASEASASGRSMEMLRLLSGFQQSQALYALAKLGVATALHGGPMTVGELAKTTETDADALRRLLHILSGIGVVTHHGADAFALTPLGSTLVADVPGSVRDMAVMWMETHYAPFSELVTTVRTGIPAATAHFGQSFAEWLGTHPEHLPVMASAMANLTYGPKDAALTGYRLPPGEVVADIGGADGSVLARLLADEPGRRGIVFDLEHVVSTAHPRLAGQGVADRIEVRAGDFFESVPAADVYLLSTVLHDWDDVSCARVLGRVAEAASHGARLVVVETVLSEGDEPHPSKLLDLTMLGMVSGHERRETEFAALFASAGFTLDRRVPGPVDSPFAILEATLTR